MIDWEAIFGSNGYKDEAPDGWVTYDIRCPKQPIKPPNSVDLHEHPLKSVALSSPGTPHASTKILDILKLTPQIIRGSSKRVSRKKPCLFYLLWFQTFIGWHLYSLCTWSWGSAAAACFSFPNMEHFLVWTSWICASSFGQLILWHYTIQSILYSALPFHSHL